MIRRVIHNFRRLSIAEQRRLIVYLVEEALLGCFVWGGFLVFMRTASWLLDTFGVLKAGLLCSAVIGLIYLVLWGGKKWEESLR